MKVAEPATGAAWFVGWVVMAGGAITVTVAVAVFVASPCWAAITWKVPSVAGAV